MIYIYLLAELSVCIYDHSLSVPNSCLSMPMLKREALITRTIYHLLFKIGIIFTGFVKWGSNFPSHHNQLMVLFGLNLCYGIYIDSYTTGITMTYNGFSIALQSDSREGMPCPATYGLKASSFLFDYVACLDGVLGLKSAFVNLY